MVNLIIRWCLNNRFVVILVTLLLLGIGYYAVVNIPIDAIPDIGEKQVIVLADWPGRSPQDVEDQVTYPLTTTLSGTPGVKTIRSFSGFGFSMVFIIFKDEVDYYWARSRVLERMNVAVGRLPMGVTPTLGSDATALGQVFYYTLQADGADLAQLRSLQDWYIRYQLQSVEGVTEVSTLGGYVREYQIDVVPEKLRAHRVTLPDVYEAVRRSNIDVGAKVVESNRYEFFIRGKGFVRSVQDIENVVIRQEGGTPIYVKNVATVQLGPEFRRGTLDNAGREATGAVVLMRYGENPLAVINRVKQKIAEIEPGLRISLPSGKVVPVKIVPYYDRTDIIYETMATLRDNLIEESMVVAFIVVLFLLHLRSSLAVLPTLPLALAMSFRRDVLDGRGQQHHVAGRTGHCHRRRQRHGHHHDGEHLSAIDEGARPTISRCCLRGLDRGRWCHRHGSRQYSRVVHPRVRTDRAGREDVPAAGVHENIRNRSVCHPRHHRRARV
jgi:Cu(I)/Ag(I) efflux system membrane protein CusA/SilA